LGFHSSQIFTRFKNSGERQRFYNFIAQYRIPLSFVEGGYRRQEGANIDLTLWTVKSYIKFRRGLLSLKVGYEFEDENSWGDFRRDNYLYTEWKRKF